MNGHVFIMNMNKKSSDYQEANNPTRKIAIFLDLSEIVHIAWNAYKRDFSNLTDYSFNVVGDTFKQIVFRVCRHVMGQLKDQSVKREGDHEFAMSMVSVIQQVISETGVIINDNYVDELTLRIVHSIEQAFLHRMHEECPVVYNEGYVDILDFKIGTIVDDPEHLTAIIQLLV